MRRLLFIPAFALFLAVPLWAQRGAHGGFGGHAGFSGGHGGFSAGHSGGFGGRGFGGPRMGGGHFSAPMHGGSRFTHAPLRSRGGPFVHNRFRGGFRDHRFHRGFRNCFGWGCGFYGYPYWGAYYDPWLSDWAYDDARFDRDYYEQYALANQMNEQSLEQQRMLRQEEADGDQDSYAPRQNHRPAPTSTPSNGEPATLPTVLVFRDQHRQEVQNYAIVGQTLWNFAPQHTQKIALADLDLPATEKVNDDRGTTFRVPGLREAQ